MKKAIVVFFLISTMCFAQVQARHIDFTKELHGLDEKPILSSDGKTPFTLGEVCVNALELSSPEDKNITGVDKLKMYELAKKIYKNKDAVLTAEEVTLIKDRVAKYYATIVVGPAFEILDPASVK